MVRLEELTLSIRNFPIGRSAVRYDSHESQASFKKAKANLSGMAGLRVESIAFDVNLDKDDRDWVYISGVQHVELSDVCSRCAERFPFSVSKRVALTFIPATTSIEAPIQDEDDGVFMYEEGLIDLFPALMESVFLDIPIKPLCDEACRGLCPQCGANRNVSPCTCPENGGTLNLGKLISKAVSLNHN